MSYTVNRTIVISSAADDSNAATTATVLANPSSKLVTVRDHASTGLAALGSLTAIPNAVEWKSILDGVLPTDWTCKFSAKSRDNPHGGWDVIDEYAQLRLQENGADYKEGGHFIYFGLFVT